MSHALPLARALRARGHRVLFVGAPSCRPFLAPFGFDFVPLTTEPEEVPPDQKQRIRTSTSALLAYSRREAPHLLAALDRWLGPGRGPLEELRDRHAPRLFAIDATTLAAPIWSLAARRLGVPAVALGTPINQAANSRVPPAWTTIPPARGPLARSRLSSPGMPSSASGGCCSGSGGTWDSG